MLLLNSGTDFALQICQPRNSAGGNSTITQKVLKRTLEQFLQIVNQVNIFNGDSKGHLRGDAEMVDFVAILTNNSGTNFALQICQPRLYS